MRIHNGDMQTPPKEMRELAGGWLVVITKNACITYSHLKMHRHAQTVHVIFFMPWFNTGGKRTKRKGCPT